MTVRALTIYAAGVTTGMIAALLLLAYGPRPPRPAASTLYAGWEEYR